MRDLSRSGVRVEVRALGIDVPRVDWYRLGEYAALYLLVSALWGGILWMAVGGLQ